MTEKLKKKPSFFTLKRWNSQKDVDAPSSPRKVVFSPQIADTTIQQNGDARNSINTTPINKTKPFTMSAENIEELVQCSLCLEMLHNPKMLPCQHTFCMACLSVYIADSTIFKCPICSTQIQVLGPNFLDDLPSNLYINSLLALMRAKDSKTVPATPPPTPAVEGKSVDLFAGGVKCSYCQSLFDNSETKLCRHCKLDFCQKCWSQHLNDMRTQIESIKKQLDSATNKLEHKIEHYKDHCEHVTEQIKTTADEKINAIIKARDDLLVETATLQKNGAMTALALKSSLEEARSVALRVMDKNNMDENEQVNIFINLYQNTIRLLSEVSKWDADSFVFDKENFRIELDGSTPLDAESDDPLPEGAKQNNPLENEDTLALHYRTRNFVPHYVWRKSARPCGIGLSPWSNHLYVCGMDSHCVFVIERGQAKTVARLTCEAMLCPVHVAFMKSTGEVFVTDKWKHCIHVFSKDNEYLRSFGQKGSRVGTFRSPEGIATDNSQLLIYVVDTGNDRVQVLQADGKFVDQIGVTARQQVTFGSSSWTNKEVLCTELNAPTSVAVTNDRVIVLDSGNRRVKVYNKNDKGKILEFGSLGFRKGQFRQPDVLTVDPMGFILVGDSGNCRVQIFKPNGQLVRVFGRLGNEPGKFGWISGLLVTKQLDVIVSDKKNQVVDFF